jgi:hypothetical protein
VSRAATGARPRRASRQPSHRGTRVWAAFRSPRVAHRRRRRARRCRGGCGRRRHRRRRRPRETAHFSSPPRAGRSVRTSFALPTSSEGSLPLASRASRRRWAATRRRSSKDSSPPCRSAAAVPSSRARQAAPAPHRAGPALRGLAPGKAARTRRFRRARRAPSTLRVGAAASTRLAVHAAPRCPAEPAVRRCAARTPRAPPCSPSTCAASLRLGGRRVPRTHLHAHAAHSPGRRQPLPAARSCRRRAARGAPARPTSAWKPGDVP